MYVRLRQFSITLLALCLLLNLASPFALAESANDLSVELSPLPISLTATPGKSITTQIRLRNSGILPETLKISLKSIRQTGYNGQIQIKDFNSSNPLPTWVHFTSTVFNAPPGQWLNIPMTINVPKSAAYGYYFAVQFSLNTPPQPIPGKAVIQGAADLFVLLNAVAPGEMTKATLTTFSTSHTLYSYLPANFIIRLHNDGNIDVAPHGNIFITRGAKTIDTIKVNSTLGSILPNSYRVYTATWDDGFPVYKDDLDVNGQTISNGHGGLKTHLDWNFSNASKLRFGHYTAKLLLVYNDGSRDIPIEASVGFWVIPWLPLLLLLIFLLFTMVGIWATIRVLVGKRKKKVIMYK